MQEPNGRNDIGDLDLVGPGLVQDIPGLREPASRPGLLLDELEGLVHHGQRLLPVLRDGHHGQDSRLQAILQHEGCSLAGLQVE